MDSTNTQALDAALATRPPLPSSAGAALGDLPKEARKFGRAKRLECADGTWMCWGCGVECPFHVSLHCEHCLQQARERRVERLLAEARQDPEDLRWAAMARNIMKLLTREQAVELIRKARELPSSTNDRVNGLNLAFDRRFDAPSPAANWGTYAQPDNDPAEDWARE
jgi:hypothetical protein